MGRIIKCIFALTQVAFLVFGSAPVSAQLLSGDRVDTSGEREAPEQVEISPAKKVSETPSPFGSNLFEGGFRAEREDGLNPDYLIQPGDRISLVVWGAMSFEGEVAVDAQGNIFLPNVGPVRVAGIRNEDLTKRIDSAIRTVFTENVNIYTNLQSTQPIVVFVTGYVKNPGSYAGISSDSILYFLTRAGGVKREQGSYRNIVVKRNGKVVTTADLYEFLLSGDLPSVQFRDKDTIVVGPRGGTVAVSGEVQNPFVFEFPGHEIAGSELMQFSRPLAHASHATLTGTRSSGPIASYYSISEVSSRAFVDGDHLKFDADQREDTILVRVEGSHLGPSRFAVPRDTTLLELLDHIEVDPRLADVESVSIRRKSLAERQKTTLEDSLRRLEAAVVGASSQTDEEAQIRLAEANLITSFIKRAREVEPQGVLVVSRNGTVSDIHLEHDDIITVPSRRQTVLVSGEVMVPQAIVYSSENDLMDYIDTVGGFTDRADHERILIARLNGEVVTSEGADVRSGDEILVLPKVPVKSLQIGKTITQILFQVALSAATVFGLID